ncbi:STAS domain-containing protein [Streptomyces sp. NPDC020141]|uniref:STAS domain-containing protein n=1 Tax=Streptomyces sp. NPDC020141 TaxID=3365065 RepID=UPI0037A24718
MTATQTVVVRISGRVSRDDVPRLCEELGAELLRAGATEAICEVGGLAPADLTAVDALARMRLTARRLGCRIRLRDASPELLALLDLIGLTGLADPG